MKETAGKKKEDLPVRKVNNPGGIKQPPMKKTRGRPRKIPPGEKRNTRSSGPIVIKDEFEDNGSVEDIGDVQTQVVGIIEKLENDDKKHIKKEESESEGEYGGQPVVTALALLDMENEVLQEMTSVPENCRTTYFFMQSFEAKLAQYFGITDRKLVDLYKRQVNFRPGDEMKVAKVVTEGMERG